MGGAVPPFDRVVRLRSLEKSDVKGKKGRGSQDQRMNAMSLRKKAGP